MASEQAVQLRPIASFRDLRVWQEAVALVKEIYSLCSRLPKDELYGLGTQMKRAAVSVPSNIAEGHARNHRREYRQSIFVAIGSLAELDTQLHISLELGLLDPDLVARARARIERLRAMLLTLANRLS